MIKYFCDGCGRECDLDGLTRDFEQYAMREYELCANCLVQFKARSKEIDTQIKEINKKWLAERKATISKIMAEFSIKSTKEEKNGTKTK